MNERLLTWGGPLLFALLLYLCIDSYPNSPEPYNLRVGHHLIAATAVVFFVMLIAGQQLSISKPLGAVIVAFSASALISGVDAPYFMFSAERLYLYYAALLFGVAVYLLNRRLPRVPVELYFLAIALLHVIFLVRIIFWLLATKADAGLVFNLVPHFGNIRHFAYFGFLAAAAATAIWLLSPRLRLASFVLATAALFGIVLLGSRGALLAWLIFVGLTAAVMQKRLGFIIFSASVLLLSGIAAWHLEGSGLVDVVSLFGRARGTAESLLYTADRLAMWQDALRGIADNPLFGFGAEGYQISQCCDRNYLQPHNFVLQFLLEFGAVGCLILAVAGVGIWKEVAPGTGIFRAMRDSPAALAVGAILAGFCAYSLIDGLFYHAIPLLHFALLTGLLLSLVANARR